MFYTQHLNGLLEGMDMSKQVSRTPYWTFWQIFPNIQRVKWDSSLVQQVECMPIIRKLDQARQAQKLEGPRCQAGPLDPGQGMKCSELCASQFQVSFCAFSCAVFSTVCHTVVYLPLLPCVTHYPRSLSEHLPG